MINDYIAVDGIKYELRRNARRKRVAIGVDGDNNFFIAAPVYTTRKELERILRENAASFIDKVAKTRSCLPAAERKYEEGGLFYFRGRQYPLRIDRGLAAGSLSFEAGEFLSAPFDDDEAIRRRFELWYFHRLRELIQAEFPAWCKRIGVGPKRVALKNVKTLWGSCSSSQSITFSVRLALVPPALMEYVMVHELCHMLEMNHSAKFWTLVGRFCGDYEARRAELKRDGGKYKW